MATAIPSAPSTASHPFRNGYFRLLWTGRAVSYLGDQFYLVALPWLVLSLTNSGIALGSIMMTGAIPTAVLMLAGGALSDRFSARRILIGTTSVRMLCVAIFGALVALRLLALWQIYVLAFIFGVADAFATPASQTLLPSIVQKDELPAANSITQSTQQLTSIVGPAPAGLVVKTLGSAWAFFIDAFSFLFVIAALWRLPDPPRSKVSKTGMLHAIGEGLRYINADAAMRSLLVVVAALNFCVAGPISIGLAWIAKHQFGSPVAFSIFIGSVAAGGLTGAVAAGFFKSRRRGVLILIVAAAVALGTALLGLVTTLWSVSAVLFAMAAASGFLNVHLVAWFQQRVDRSMLGRVMSVIMFAAVGLQPISLAIAGLAITWSVSGTFLAAAALMLLVTAFASLNEPVRKIE